jgi:hypothetical protein
MSDDPQVPPHDLMLHAHHHDGLLDEPHEHPHTGPGHMGIEHSHPHSRAPRDGDEDLAPSAADLERARELEDLLGRIQSDPGGKLDAILAELRAVRSALEDVRDRLAALERKTP